MSLQDNSRFRRFHQHAQKRLVFDPGVARSQQLPAYKRYLELENVMLERMHRKGESGRQVCQARAAMIDVIIENLFLAALDLYATEHGVPPCKMAVLATGGYGRRELNPHSDIDLMFLYPIKADGKTFETFQGLVAEEMLYPLWDLGLKVGHASRNAQEVIEECRKEMRSKNAILESRPICGSRPLYERMRSRFEAFVEKENSRVYIQQRLEDERARHAKSGNTTYLQEPDIKNGVGGLRDYQNIFWMAQIKDGFRSFQDLVAAKLLRADQCDAMGDAYDFLLRTRTELHLQNRRPTDKLDLEQQPVIAEYLGYPQQDIFERVEAFMKDYYMAARTIYQMSEMLKERMALEVATEGRAYLSESGSLSVRQQSPSRRIEGFALHEKVLSIDDSEVFEQDPVRLIRVFRLAQQLGAHLDSDLRFLITRSVPLIDHAIINSSSAAKSFCAILRNPGEVFPILTQMHELGVLGRYLPEFGELTCMVQHEYYHRYTADAHVLRTIRHLDRVFAKYDDEYARYEKELRKNDDPLLLYLILLLHDIGKAEGVKNHDVNGVRIAQPVLRRFDIGSEQQEQILFIIRHHLEMSRIWQRFDLDDPQTAASFAEFIEDPQNLRFLYVHTYCDARGTAPTLWNGYKDAMHRTLYLRTLEQFEDDAVLERKHKSHMEMLRRQFLQKQIKGLSTEEIEAHFDLLPERYFINTHSADIELHLHMVNRLFQQLQADAPMASLAPVIDWHDDIDLSMSVVDVVTWDRAGLFYKLAGALTLAGVDIVSTKAITRKDDITIDTFYVMEPGGGVVSNKKAHAIFEQHLKEALIEEKELMPAIQEHESRIQAATTTKDMLPAPFPPRVEVYHELSLRQTIIEVQANDRIGLLYRLSRLITKRGFDIIFARVATERGVAMDTFYIKNDQSEQDSYTTSLLELREKLEKIIDR